LRDDHTKDILSDEFEACFGAGWGTDGWIRQS